MKILPIIATILLSGAVAMAQKTRSDVVMALIENTDGVVYGHGIPEPGHGTYYFFTQVPSFYDFELIAMDIKLCVGQYGDVVKTTLPWTKDSDNYFKSFSAYNYEFTIIYKPKEQTVWYLLNN